MSKTEIPPVAIDLDGATDIGADIVDADLFLIDDGAGGTMRKTTASRIKTYASGLTGVTTGSGNVTITDGNLIVASGHGIDFSAQTASSATGVSVGDELLDHYEEGTWTPTFRGSTGHPTVTYDIRVGRYVKVGHLVHIQGRVRSDATSGGSGNLDLGDLPFTNIASANAYLSALNKLIIKRKKTAPDDENLSVQI